MGIFDSDSEDEVKISPEDKEEGESRLKDEVENEIVGGGDSSSASKTSSGSSRGKAIRERSNSTGKSSFSDSREVSLEDVHRQNKKIIGLLEEIAGEDFSEEDEDNDVTGDLNGVL